MLTSLIYTAAPRDSEAFPTQVGGFNNKQDTHSLQAFPNKWKRKDEKLKAQLLRKIVPARGAHKSKSFILISSTGVRLQVITRRRPN